MRLFTLSIWGRLRRRPFSLSVHLLCDTLEAECGVDVGVIFSASLQAGLVLRDILRVAHIGMGRLLMTLVFISYTRRTDYDKQFAERLRTWLLKSGFDVWMDVHDIPSGAHWDSEIDKALRAADVVLGLVSPASVESDNVKNEWAWALDKGKLQLALLAPADIPHRFIRIDYIDLSKNDNAAWEKLYRTLVDLPSATEDKGNTQTSNPIQEAFNSLMTTFGLSKSKRVPRMPGSSGKRNLAVGVIIGVLIVCGGLTGLGLIINALAEGMIDPNVFPETPILETVGGAAAGEAFLTSAFVYGNIQQSLQYVCPQSQNAMSMEFSGFSQMLISQGITNLSLSNIRCMDTSPGFITCSYTLTTTDSFGFVNSAPAEWQIPVRDGYVCPTSLDF